MIDTPTRKVLEFSLTLTGPLGLGLQSVLEAAEAAGFSVEATDAKLKHAPPEGYCLAQSGIGSVIQQDAEAGM